MQCVICKTGETKKSTASFTVEKEGSYLIFSDVPAEVCTNCGEAYFSAETAEELQQKATKAFQKGKEVEIVRLAF